MLCSVISQVFSVRGPVEYELALDHAATNPMEYHVHGFGALGYNYIAGDFHGTGIVGLDRRLPLGPFHFYESFE